MAQGDIGSGSSGGGSSGSSGSSILGPLAVVSQFLGGLFGGGGQEEMPGNLHLVNPAQQALYANAARMLMGGAGDFGLGSGIKQGGSQLAQFMAARGISPQSGAYAGAYGNMVGNAMSADVNARRQFGLSLLGTPLQTATVTGANLVPGSPSNGWSSGAQEASWNRYQNTGYVTPTVGGQFFGSTSKHPEDPTGQGWKR